MKNRGFTLWEVLGVLALVMIIAAIVFPFFAKSRESHHPPSCQANLKQIALSFNQYQGDYNDGFPPIILSDVAGEKSPYGWADALQPYLKSTHILQCITEADTKKNATPDQRGYTDYWFNRNLAEKKYLSRISDEAAYTIMMGDGNDGQDETTARYSLSQLPASWRTDKNSPAYRHLGGAWYAFVDGHTKWYKPDQVLNGPSPLRQPTFSIQ